MASREENHREESDENNNTDPKEKSQASSRESIFSHRAIRCPVVGSRKRDPIRLQAKREREVPKKLKKKPRPKGRHPPPSQRYIVLI
jgi:hypothetical protein